eukprot:CAMPEP_0177664062 /NCGR_PEP_ID=MMETSP0447-20121125/20276_1 /TAXON_ID=0 /ORGANISM="Stygamoeba regulata, Strain BSH-02190019" /LENGTH=206 /DNA_ID=CAMNT_0019169975 /DNA_START=144 /DNA_END=761 /DNA_ORIENTATION=-
MLHLRGHSQHFVQLARYRHLSRWAALIPTTAASTPSNRPISSSVLYYSASGSPYSSSAPGPLLHTRCSSSRRQIRRLPSSCWRSFSASSGAGTSHQNETDRTGNHSPPESNEKRSRERTPPTHNRLAFGMAALAAALGLCSYAAYTSPTHSSAPSQSHSITSTSQPHADTSSSSLASSAPQRSSHVSSSAPVQTQIQIQERTDGTG